MDYVFAILILVAITAGVYWLIKKVKRSGNDMEGDFLHPEQIEKRREYLEKIVALAKAQGKINDSDVIKALKVSDATANRYLEYLVNLGKLSRIGERGQGVYYQIPRG